MDTSANRSYAGRRAHAAGAMFEQMIAKSCLFYETHGYAAIDKTPEPMKPLKRYDKHPGWFIATFTRSAQPDYKGILQDGTMLMFDAKHTEKDRIQRGAVTEEQEACFERYQKHGANCFLVISLGFERYYRVPWNVFRDMKERFGHKYMAGQELEPYEVVFSGGILRFLDGIELKGE